MSQSLCINCGRLNCKGKCPIRRTSPPATVAPDQPKALAFEKTLNTLNQTNIGGWGSTASYSSSFQSTRSRTQVKATKKRGSEASGSSGSASQLEHGRNKRATQDLRKSRTDEWLSQDRGIPVPLGYQQNSIQQRNTSTLRLQCPFCPRNNFKDKSKLSDHMRSHSKDRPFLCPKYPRCLSQYKYGRDLREHCRKRCRFRDESGVCAAPPIPIYPWQSHSQAQPPASRDSSIPRDQSPPHHQSPSSYPHRIPSCVDPPPENTPHDQSGFPARDEEPSGPTSMDLDRVAQQTLENRRPRLDDAISNATQVERQLDDAHMLWVETYFGGVEPGTFTGMLGEKSEFETCDYSDRAQGGSSSAEGKGI